MKFYREYLRVSIYTPFVVYKKVFVLFFFPINYYIPCKTRVTALIES